MKKVNKIIIALLAVAILIIPVAAAAMQSTTTPSVSQKGAPQLEPMEDKNGDPVDAIVYDENGGEVGSIPVGGIMVTPLADAQEEDSTVPEAIKEELNEAYDSVNEAKSLTEAAPKVAQALEEADTGLTMEDLVARDIFHVLLDQDTIDAIAGADKISLVFDLEMDEDSFLMIMRYVKGEWLPVPLESAVINADGTVTVTLELIEGQVGTIALLTEKIIEE